ncbi:hypothetical protein GCM10010912_28860 [Paenibacillus albidus]|uniref:Uncharacterized protein n=1 Tax=Paenibacillus albidus TaxID=2041023 RepID=A0A917CBP9_9BACL|nr:hypothetical protein GCM10010912_28860 [Paenibacillus albidus]
MKWTTLKKYDKDSCMSKGQLAAIASNIGSRTSGGTRNEKFIHETDSLGTAPFSMD